jgi:DNA-binding CsgD family transcriptional regulator
VDKGHYAEAEPLLDEAIATARQAGDLDREAVALTQAGMAAWGRGRHLEATAHLQRAGALWEELGSPSPAWLIRHLANVAADAGDLACAAEGYRRFVAEAPGSAFVLARLLCDVAALAAAVGEPERAARLFGAAAELSQTIGLAPAYPERRVHKRATAAIREALGEDAFVAQSAAGMRFSEEDAFAEINAVLEVAARAPAHRGGRLRLAAANGLTHRELEVLRLLAQRQTHREIAERLFVSRRTASKHVASILAKLGVSDRRAAAAEAVRLDLA